MLRDRAGNALKMEVARGIKVFGIMKIVWRESLEAS